MTSNFQRLLTHILAIAGWMAIAALPAAAKSPAEQASCPPPQAQSDGSFSGIILTRALFDGVRALRPDVATTYYIAFDGANITDGGTPSPDGRYYAVPNGYIQTNTTADVRYVVQELRIITTERVPRVVARIPWQASFPVGTRFAPTQGIARLTWLDSETFVFPSGSMNTPQTWQQVKPFSTPVSVIPFEAGAWQPLSPDQRRGLKPDARGWAVYDVASRSEVGRLPPLSASQQMAWSPDSARLAAVIDGEAGTSLALFWRGGALANIVHTAEAGTSIANLRWSPDGRQLAYTVFDPQSGQNRLYLYNLDGEQTTITCLDLLNLPDVVTWSPDGLRLAVLAGSPTETGLYAYAPDENRLERLATLKGGSLLGWYAIAP